MKQFFFCVKAAQQGGETPILDCREVARRLDPALLARFAEKGLMYVRNFSEGIDVPWQKFFHTDDRAVVEQWRLHDIVARRRRAQRTDKDVDLAIAQRLDQLGIASLHNSYRYLGIQP